ncbi:hypothetical protein P3745_25165, partial [Vibrio parahaemolyticus]|nr:hypothetical protein [Vibrio parahaemolyticus]
MNSIALPRVEVSAHAIDRLSERCLHIWQEQGRERGVGLMSFFITKSREAYATLLNAVAGNSISICSCKVSHDGVTYVFTTENGVT